MADPRFYDNRGPFTLAELCGRIDAAVPKDANADAQIFDLAGLAEAGPPHLTYFSGGRDREALTSTKAGWCLIAHEDAGFLPETATPIEAASAQRAFAAAARQFYPENELVVAPQTERIDSSARIGDDTILAPGVVVGPGAEIGRGTRIGANAVIGRGVAIGRNCEIGSNASMQFAYLGDDVVVQSGARIGGSGFGFVSGPDGHEKIPQLGRVVIQDRVEVGANSAIDRGVLGDTVIGEGTKIDNLVQIGHNTQIGRHCIIVAKVGVSGSVRLGDFVVLGGGVGVADHLVIGDGARVAGMSGVMWSLSGGRTYCGYPALPNREFFREVAALAKLAKTRRKTQDE